MHRFLARAKVVLRSVETWLIVASGVVVAATPAITDALPEGWQDDAAMVSTRAVSTIAVAVLVVRRTTTLLPGERGLMRTVDVTAHPSSWPDPDPVPPEDEAVEDDPPVVGDPLLDVRDEPMDEEPHLMAAIAAADPVAAVKAEDAGGRFALFASRRRADLYGMACWMVTLRRAAMAGDGSLVNVASGKRESLHGWGTDPDEVCYQLRTLQPDQLARLRELVANFPLDGRTGWVEPTLTDDGRWAVRKLAADQED